MLLRVAIGLLGGACTLAFVTSVLFLQDMAGTGLLAGSYSISIVLAITGMIAYTYHVAFEWEQGEDGPESGPGRGPGDDGPDHPIIPGPRDGGGALRPTREPVHVQ